MRGVAPLLRAGTLDEATPASGEWLFVDVGFSSTARSCGLLLGEGAPRCCTFAEARAELVAHAAQPGPPLNLVLEAPLSVAFSAAGNPVGRSIERRGGRTRYWYIGLGCSVMVAASYLVAALCAARRAREVRLFEGFVSFKPATRASCHRADVLRLRDVVWQVPAAGHIVPAGELARAPGDVLQSAFTSCGANLGVPPVIVADVPE